VYGDDPPDALTVAEYALPFTAAGSDVVVTVTGVATTMVNSFVAVPPAESLTSSLKPYFPAVLGVPLHTPAVERLRPGGKVPESRDHVYGDVPPEADIFAEYAFPVVP
jgi:hypothetical protein